MNEIGYKMLESERRNERNERQPASHQHCHSKKENNSDNSLSLIPLASTIIVLISYIIKLVEKGAKKLDEMSKK